MNMKNTKRILALLLCFAMLFSFAACGAKEDIKKNLTKITFCLDWTPNTNHTGLYVAQAKGYFEEAGLDVTIVQPGESSAATLCAANKAQFAVECQDMMAASFASDEPLDVSAVAAILQHNTSGIISRKGEGMDRPKGLEGKTYATWDSPTEQATLREAMAKDGGDFSKVKLIPNEITDEAGALKEHLADAIWVFYGWSGINAELTGLDFDYFYFKDIDPVFDYYTPVIIGNNKFMQENPEVTKAFLKATAKGYEYAIANPEESAQILVDGDTTGSLKDSLELVTASQKWISKQYKAEVERWGYIEPARWDGFYAWLWENKLVEKELPQGTGYTNAYLPE